MQIDALTNTVSVAKSYTFSGPGWSEDLTSGSLPSRSSLEAMVAFLPGYNTKCWHMKIMSKNTDTCKMKNTRDIMIKNVEELRRGDSDLSCSDIDQIWSNESTLQVYFLFYCLPLKSFHASLSYTFFKGYSRKLGENTLRK